MDRRAPTSWKAHPALALVVRALLVVSPVLLSVFVTTGLARTVVRPADRWPAIAWWVFIAVAGTAVVYTADLLLRRLLPLAALLKLSLVFPDRAPARFGVALKTGTPKQLARRLAEARTQGLGDTPQEAAETLLTLVAALSVHDRLTRGHCERVRAYTDLIAKELNLGQEDTSKIHWAAMVHDIGKLEVPAEILSKPTRLTDEEFEIIKGHPEAGARLAAPLVDWLGEWFHAIDHHHERWDGRGYPYGLAGTDISLAGRIVAVADVFDVITAARSYKKPQPAAQARVELARCAGTQFDPEVVRAFLNISFGRLRVMLGPLSWLTELPVLSRIPLAPAASAAGAAASAVVAVTVSVMSGFLHAEPADAHVGARPSDPVVTVVGASSPPATSPSVTVDTRSPEPTTTTTAVTGPTTTTATTTAPETTTTTTTAPETTTTTTTAPAPTPTTVEVALPEPTARTVEVAAGSTTAWPMGELSTWTDGTWAHIVRGPARGSAEITEGALRFRAPDDFGGTLSIDYEVCNPRGCATATVSVVVTPPPLQGGDDAATTAEDTPVEVAVLANDRGGRAPYRVVAVDTPSNGAVVVTGDTLRYTPAADTHGTDTFTYTLGDAAGTLATGTVTVTVTPVNDAPTFTTPANLTVAEDAGPQTHTTWITAASPGPPDESAQTLTYTVTAANPSLFATAPTIAPDGTLTYTTADNANGATTLTITATDSAGATSTPHTATLIVTAVNDAPTFTTPANLTVAEDAGPQTHTTWVTAINPGPADESAQTVTLAVTTDNPSLFATGPAVAPDGTLSYTTADNSFGTTTLTITATDSAGATSTPHTATLTVTAVNDAPTAEDDRYTTPQDTALVVSAGSGLLANDHDTDSDPFTVTAIGVAAGNVVWSADGAFTYTPVGASTTTDSFTYTITDSAGASHTAIVTITISATPFSMSTLHLLPGTPGADDWALGAAPTASAIADYDSDGNPGLTIKKSSGKRDEDDPLKFQNFLYIASSDIVLDGPVTVHLVASTEGLFSKSAHPSLYLEDCAADGTDCQLLASTDVHVGSWSGLFSTWAEQTFALGSVDHTITTGRALRLKVLTDHHDLWIAMSQSATSRIELSLG